MHNERVVNNASLEVSMQVEKMTRIIEAPFIDEKWFQLDETDQMIALIAAREFIITAKAFGKKKSVPCKIKNKSPISPKWELITRCKREFFLIEIPGLEGVVCFDRCGEKMVLLAKQSMEPDANKKIFFKIKEKDRTDYIYN